jgi:hypothetical protein
MLGLCGKFAGFCASFVFVDVKSDIDHTWIRYCGSIPYYDRQAEATVKRKSDSLA